MAAARIATITATTTEKSRLEWIPGCIQRLHIWKKMLKINCQNEESGKEKYILTCRDVWRLGGWCDKVSGCYWPEMTVKAVFANFTATSRDICPLLLHPPHPLIEAAPTRTTWPPGPIMAPRLGQASLGPTWPPEPQGPTGPPNQKFERDIWLLT